MSLSVGPHYSAGIGPFRVRLETDGEMVLRGTPETGYLHRGIEKIGSRMTWAGFLPFTDRIDYLAACHCNHAYAMAVEKLANIDVPERAECIRVIVSELNRIASHLIGVGFLARQLGADTAFMYSLRDRERINNLFELLCGARLTYSYVRIGGVAADLTEGFIEKAYEFADYLLPKVKEYNDLLSYNSIFIGRLAGVGAIASQQAIDCGLSGPNIRASGLKLDLRKLHAYSGYHKFDFDVPVGKGEMGQLGDSFDRYIVRIREIEQSASLVKQALDELPDGKWCNPPARDFIPSQGEAYAAVESPRGTFGVYVRSTGAKHPDRVKFRTPSFAVLNLFPEILSGVQLSDVPTILASLDVAVSEVDR